jgi:hypothetical protein
MNKFMIPCSGKMVLLDKLLPKLKKEGHKVIYIYLLYIWGLAVAVVVVAVAVVIVIVVMLYYLQLCWLMISNRDLRL